MATPVPLYAALEEAWMEREAMRRRALANDGRIDHHEAVAIFAYEAEHIGPRLMTMTTTVQTIESLVRGGDGIYGSRVQRTLRSLWRSRGTVVPFRQRNDQEPPEAA